MIDSPSLLMTLIAFLLVIGPLILVHELGHYLVGRLFGVKAEVFSIGFGKELAGWTDRRGTRWKLSALPLGGYVQFAGDMNPASMPDRADDGLSEEERAQTFHLKPLWQRSLIVAAGPLTNLIVAVAIFAAFNLAYGKVVATPEVSGFAEGSDARAAGVEVGDRILAVNGKEVASVTDIPAFVVPFPGQTISLTVRRNGESLILPVTLDEQEVTDEFGNKATVADLGIDFTRPVVGGFSSDSPAEAAGIQVGDRIQAVGGSEVNGFLDVAELVRSRPGETVPITVIRAGERLTVPVKLGVRAEQDESGREVRVGFLGVEGSFGDRVSVGPLEAVTLGVDQSIGIMRLMVTGLGQIITGQRSVEELGGPIKIAKFSGEQLSLGWEAFVYFVALISINLAFINLLPIPALDGGHLAFYAAEAVRRKPLDVRSQEWAFRTGLALVLALMLFVTINDVASLTLFGG